MEPTTLSGTLSRITERGWGFLGETLASLVTHHRLLLSLLLCVPFLPFSQSCSTRVVPPKKVFRLQFLRNPDPDSPFFLSSRDCRRYKMQ